MPVVFEPSRCFISDDLEELYPLLSLGDLLEFIRTGYAHWAVYVGIQELTDGALHHCVIHRAVPAEATKTTLFLASRSAQKVVKVAGRVSQLARSQVTQIGEVHLHDIRSVLENDRVRINNSKDKEWRPKEAQEIVARAFAALNAIENTPYHLLTNNCEHFANSCRYGKNTSQQVPDLLGKAGGTFASVVVPIAARNAATALILPAIGIAATGPVGLAITGVAAAAGIIGAAIPPIVHVVQCIQKK